ncbi:MAG: hypothetical protein ABJA94_08440 [Rhodoglobus sp.]
MIITLDGAAIGSGLGAAVPALTLEVGPGIPSVLAVETAERPLLVSMLLGGRLRPDAGRVLADGTENLDDLRRRSALVDTPVVAEPAAGVTLATVVAEELSFAAQASSRKAVRQFLVTHGLAEFARVPVRAVPPVHRIRLFCELALLRGNVTALVLTSPERHGGEPTGWYEPLAAIAARGVTIAIVTDATTAGTLISLGAADALAPQVKEAA